MGGAARFDAARLVQGIAGVGGNPVKSKYSRRASVIRSASGEGVAPLAAILASSRRSMSFRGQSRRRISPRLALAFESASRRDAATSGRCGAIYAQCGSYFAPALIHRRKSSTSAAESGGFFDSRGGIRTSGSSLATRVINSLPSASRGTIAHSVAPSSRSSRNSAFRAAESGPWQAKQRSARIGRMSRLKLGSSAAAVAASRHNTMKKSATRVTCPVWIQRQPVVG